MGKHKITHTGELVGCDSRTPDDYRKTVEVRETANYWVVKEGNGWTKYRKDSGWPAGKFDWPLYYLDLDSLRPV